MPLLRLETTVALSDENKQAMLASLSKMVAGTIGKPEQYVMVAINQPAAMMMSRKDGETAFVDIRSIGGLNSEVNRQLTQKVCSFLKGSLGLAPNRVYLNFTDIPADNWGWNGETFG